MPYALGSLRKIEGVVKGVHARGELGVVMVTFRGFLSGDISSSDQGHRLECTRGISAWMTEPDFRHRQDEAWAIPSR